MAVPRRDSLQASLPQPLQRDSHAVRPLSLQITMAAAQRQASQTTIYKAIRMPRKHWSCKSQWHQCTDTLRKHPSRGRQPAATTRAAAPSGGSGYCACHEDSQRHQRRQPAPQPLLAALGTAPATRKTASGTSGDNARRSPFWRLWVLRLPRRQPAAPSGDNARRSPFWRLWVLRLPRGRQPAAPAATTRAAAPSGGSGYCACHEDSQRHQRRQPAPQPLLEALGWVLRLPRRQPAAPAATTRAAAPSGGSGYCACHEEDSQRHQRRQRAPQPLLKALGTAPATKTASGTSGDNPRRSPFWRLWVLRLPRRQPAAPAATTRAAAPSGGSGYCACE